jgi:hypothetical protein
MSIRAELVHAYRHTDGQTGVDEVKGDFRALARA